MPTTPLRRLSARERIVAVADAGSAEPVNAALAAPRPSPHLGRYGLATQDDDGVALARATIHGRPVLLAAQDERFMGGSVGMHHGAALREIFTIAHRERPAALVLLAASGGVRLHEANPAELELARALARLLDACAAGVPVLTVGVGDVFGGASVLACAADEIALLPGTRLGLSGPRVIESTHGKGELAADDAGRVAAIFGAEARAQAGQVALVADDAAAVRGWIVSALGRSESFVARVARTQTRLGERLAEAAPAATPLAPVPVTLMPAIAIATPVDGEGWLRQWPGRMAWITRPPGAGTFGPRFAHGLDSALLDHVASYASDGDSTVIIVCDSSGHEATAAAESLCVSQYLAQHAAVLALLRARGVRLIGLLAGTGHSAAFFANALQAPRLFAVEGARVVAMEAAAIARVTGLDGETLAARIDDDPLVGHAVRHFTAWGGVAAILPEVEVEELLALADGRIA